MKFYVKSVDHWVGSTRRILRLCCAIVRAQGRA